MTKKLVISAILSVVFAVSTTFLPGYEPIQPIPVESTFDFEALIATKDIVIEASPIDKLEAILEEQATYEVQLMSSEPTMDTTAIEAYRQTYFPYSPVTTEMIVRISDHYNIPVGFILAVGHNESHMGTKGRAVATMNPMNVGNTDAGDYKAVVCGVANNCLNDWEQGLNAFGTLIRDCYFHEGEEIKLDTWMARDFRAVRCGLEGKRYMTDWRALGKYQERIHNLQTFNIKY